MTQPGGRDGAPPAGRGGAPGTEGQRPALTVLAAGARCGVSRSAFQLAMIARADRVNLRPTQLVDGEGRAVPMHLASRLPADVHGLARLIALGAPALREAVETARIREMASPALSPGQGMTGGPLERPMPVFLATAESGRPDADPERDRELLRAIGEMTGIALDLERSEVFPLGRAGLAAALSAAEAFLSRSRPGSQAALVGGVDSHDHPEAISWLDARGRRRLPGSEGGVIPGEGGAFLVVGRARAADTEAAAGLSVWLSAAATATDGAGALRAAVSCAPAPPRCLLAHDTGDPAGRAEWLEVAAALRLGDVPVEMWPPFMGDAGAATGPLLAAVADCRLRMGRAENAPIAVALRSEEGLSGAFVIGCRGAPRPAVGRGRAEPSAREGGAASPRVRACLGELEKIVPGRGRRWAEHATALDEAWRALVAVAEGGSADVAGGLEQARSAVTRALDDVRQVPGAARRAAVSRLSAIARHLEAELAERGEAPPPGEGERQPGETDTPAPEDRFAGVPRGVPVLHSLGVEAWRPFSWRAAAAADLSAPALPRVLSDEEIGIARSCMEVIGRQGWQRSLRPNSLWSPAIGATEARLLENVDTIFALAGPGWGVYTGGPAHDPSADILSDVFERERSGLSGGELAFARALLLCSIDAPAGPRTAALSLALSRPHLLQAQRAAFQLAPGPHVRSALGELLCSGDPVRLRFALDVLAARREAPFGPLVALSAHPEPGVRAAALRAMAHVADRDAARGFLSRLAFLSHPPEVALALADSLLRLDARAGLELARDALSRRAAEDASMPVQVRSSFVRLVALAGGAADLPFLEDASEPADIESAGWLGYAGAADWLLAKLSEAGGGPGAHGPPALAAAEALRRLTGASAAELDAPEHPVLDPSRWKAFWTRHRARFGLGHKLRHGLPITPAAVIDELTRPGVPQGRRATLAHELSLMLPGVRVPEPDDWVARQLSTLRDLREAAERGDFRDLHAAGDWLVARLGRRRGP